jgi:hypothetical protein
MARWGLMCLLVVSIAMGQTGNTTPLSSVRGQETSKPAPTPADDQDFGFPADKVPQDTPIIIITGLCDHPPSAKSAVSDCKTVITRAEFDEIIDVLKPHATQAARKLLAMSYVHALVKEQKALDMGLDKRPDFANRMEVHQMLVSQVTLDEALNRQAWDEVSDKEIEDYYRNNPAEFVQVDAERIFVPWFEPDDDPNKKFTEAEKQERDREWQRALKEEAYKLHSRALAGEDFLDLQKEAYKFTDVSSDVKRMNITLSRTRRLMLTPALMPLMDLEPGQISAVLVEDNGYYIFKATKKVSMPFDDRVRKEIHTKFRDERVKKDKADIERLAVTSTTYNESYFGPLLPPPTKTPASDTMPVEKGR